MSRIRLPFLFGVSCLALTLGLARAQPVQTVPGMPAVTDPTNVYSEDQTGKMSPATVGVSTIRVESTTWTFQSR